MVDNYSQLIERIARAAGIGVEEIDRKVEAKRAKLSGLVSKEGAAQIIAAELGINFEKEKMKISELVAGMKRANTVGKIVELSPIRSYSKNGREGKVCNLVLADNSGNVKTVLWDTNHISLFEQEKIKLGDVVEISNGSIRNGELHLSSFGDIKLSNEIIDAVVKDKSFKINKLSDAQAGQGIKVRGFIVQVFEPRYFEVCPECGKRAFDRECKVHGAVEPKKRALLNIVIDDGSESMRSVLFGDHIGQLGLSEEEIFSLEKFNDKKLALLGEERFFSGVVKSNTLYNTLEFTIEQIENVDPAKLLQELEGKSE